MEVESYNGASEQQARFLDAIRSEVFVAANNGSFHADVPIERDHEWHSVASNQSGVLSALHKGGFSAQYRAGKVRVEWGHALLQKTHTPSELRPLAGERASTTVEEARHSSLCRRVPRGAVATSRYYDAGLTVLSPEAVLERARARLAEGTRASPSASAAAVQRAVEKLTQGETGLKLSRLSSAANLVEAESSLGVLENEIDVQRDADDSRHSIDSLFGEINTSAKSKGEDPLASLEQELAKGGSSRQLREVEALIEEVDMAATPNTRRKNQIARKQNLGATAAKNSANNASASSSSEPTPNRLELTNETLARTSKAKVVSDEVFEKESRRLAKQEETREADLAARREAERLALIKAADEAERSVEESSRSNYVISNSNATAAAVNHTVVEDERQASIRAEKRDRELKEQALAEERRNLAELKNAQMDALAAQRRKEEKESNELRAEMELEERARELAHQQQLEKERLIVDQHMREKDAILAQQQVEMERDALAKVEAAKKAQAAEMQRKKEELERLNKEAQQQTQRLISVPDDVAFTPIASNKGGVGSELETPLTLQVKDELNIEAMLGQLDFDLDVTRPIDNAPKSAAVAAPVNKHLGVATSSNVNMSRDSTARELEGLDNLALSGMEGFSLDTTAPMPASSSVSTPSAQPLGNSRTGGLKLRDEVKTDDLDVDGALGSMDFDSVQGAPRSAAQKMRHDVSVVVPHDTAREVVEATHTNPPNTVQKKELAAPVSNAFDDFKLDTLDTTGTHISASALDVKVNLDAIGASPAKAAAETKAAADKAKAEADAKSKAEADAKAKAAAAPVVAVEEKKAEVIQDEKSKAGFGDKKAMFDQKPAEQKKPNNNNNGGGGKKNNKNKNKKKK